MNKCPYCEKGNFIPDVVIENTKAYGTNWHEFRCLYCEKVVRAYFARRVTVHNITKSYRKNGDWG